MCSNQVYVNISFLMNYERLIIIRVKIEIKYLYNTIIV